MKKIVLSIFIILVGCFFLNQIFKRERPTTVVQFASWGSESEINLLKPILKDFESENPQIKVDFMHIPQNYFQKIHLLFASNTPPDVIFINNQYLPIYANAELLQDLSEEFDFDKFYEKSVEAMKWDGKIYAVPRDVSNMVVFYNKDLLEKYAIDEPTGGWDLEDFLDISKKITHLPEVFGVSFDEAPLFYLPYLTTCGGWTREDTENYFSKNVLENGINSKSLNFYADLRNKYHVAPKKEEISSMTSAQMFLQGRIGMLISGRWLVPKFRQEAKFDWDVEEFPACQSGEKSSVPMDTSGWAIAKNSKHKKEAIKLIKYLSSEKNISKMSLIGLITPARTDVAESAAFLDDKLPKKSKVFLLAAKNSVPTPITLNYREILDNLKSKTEPLFNK